MVLKNRQVIIMQGLSGSGKTTWAQANYPNATVISTDLYFSKRTDEYEFVPGQLPRAHAWCLRRYIRALDRGDSTIVVDNTNTERWEWGSYKALAEAWGYKWSVANIYDSPAALKRGYIYADSPAALTDEQLADRNVHGVPAEAIARQRERYSHARPEELYSEV